MISGSAISTWSKPLDHAEIIQKTQEYVRRLQEYEGSGHDWWHTYRVCQMAQRIGQEEGADLFVVQLAALLHDISDYKLNGGDDSLGSRLAMEWLSSLETDAETVRQVGEIVHEITFRGADTPAAAPRSLEGRVVQDADRLDALGAIGIARAFAYGGHRNRPLYDPHIPPTRHATFEAYKRNQSPTINHFYEKLLLLRDLINTQTGKQIAARRHTIMEQYLEQFFLEWDGRDTI
jgi:uncharacterized protein